MLGSEMMKHAEALTGLLAILTQAHSRCIIVAVIDQTLKIHVIYWESCIWWGNGI